VENNTGQEVEDAWTWWINLDDGTKDEYLQEWILTEYRKEVK
jgi:hypothetical protein